MRSALFSIKFTSLYKGGIGGTFLNKDMGRSQCQEEANRPRGGFFKQAFTAEPDPRKIILCLLTKMETSTFYEFYPVKHSFQRKNNRKNDLYGSNVKTI